MFFWKLLCLTFAYSILSSSSYADGVRDCDAALIKGTYESTSTLIVDWRLAKHVDESSYNAVKHDAAANAVIYGVPMGASYGDFQENVKKASSGSEESLRVEQFRNIAWTGLDENASKAYSECVRSVALQARKMISLIPIRANRDTITFRVVYSPVGASPIPLPVKWPGGAQMSPDLPTTLEPGEQSVVVKRPTEDASLAVNGGGATDDMVLTAIPAVLPPETRPTSCKFDAPPAEQKVLARGATATWICEALRPGTYTVSFSATPTSDPAGVWFRVNYGLSVRMGAAGVPAPLPSPGVFDINVNAGLGNTMTSNGGQFDHPGGTVRVELAIGGVYNHNDFQNGTAGSVVLPDNLTLRLARITN